MEPNQLILSRSQFPLRKSSDKWKEFVSKNNRFSDNNNYTLRVVSCSSEQSPVSREEFEELVADLQKYGMKRIGRDLFALLAARFFDYEKHHFIIPLDEFAVILFKVNKYKEDSNKGRGSSRRRITISNLQDQIESQFSDPITENIACKKAELLLRKYFQIETFEKDVTAYHPELLFNVANLDDLIMAIKRIKPKKTNKKEHERGATSIPNEFEAVREARTRSNSSASEPEEDPNESAMIVECKAPHIINHERSFVMAHNLELSLRATEQQRSAEQIEQRNSQPISFPAAYAALSDVYNRKIAMLRTVEDVIRFKEYVMNFNCDLK